MQATETQSSTTPLLRVRDVSVHFNNGDQDIVAAQHVSFDIHSNEIFALVGESGSGKSVTAKSIMGLLPYPKAFHPNGSIVWSPGQDDPIELVGAPAQTLESLRGNRISIIFQEPLSALNPLQTIRKQLSEVITQHRTIGASELSAECDSLLEQVQIRDGQRILSAYPHQLSGGQRQRIMIAIAIANRPNLLIADEPTTALDVTVQKEILELLIHLKNTLNMSILLITHDLSIVKRYADRVAVMQQGRIIETNQVSNLFSAPQHAYTQTLIEASHLNSSISNTPELAHDAPCVLDISGLSVYVEQKRGLFKAPNTLNLVSDINFRLHQGQTIGLVGESGSGKSSTAMGLIGLMRSRGAVRLNGQQINTLSAKAWQPIRQHIQIVFQDPFSSLSPRMSARQIICEGLRIHSDLSDDEQNAQAERMMQEVGLDNDMLNRYPHEFSGGQRQRLAIARALILNPKVLILDEPTSALDKPIQAQIINLLEALQAKYKLSYVFISHDLNLIRHICDEVIVLQNGQCVEQGRVSDVFNSPQKAYTQTLINSVLN